MNILTRNQNIAFKNSSGIKLLIVLSLLFPFLVYSKNLKCTDFFLKQHLTSSQKKPSQQLLGLQTLRQNLKALESQIRESIADVNLKNLNIEDAKSNLEFLFEKDGMKKILKNRSKHSDYYALSALKILERMMESLELQVKGEIPETVTLNWSYINQGFFHPRILVRGNDLQIEMVDQVTSHSQKFFRINALELQSRLKNFETIYQMITTALERRKITPAVLLSLSDVSDVFFSIYTRTINSSPTALELEQTVMALQQVLSGKLKLPRTNEIAVFHPLSEADLIKYNSLQSVLEETIFTIKVFDNTASSPADYKGHDRGAHNELSINPTNNFLNRLKLYEFSETLKSNVMARIENFRLNSLSPKKRKILSEHVVDENLLRHYLTHVVFQVEHESTGADMQIRSVKSQKGNYQILFYKVLIPYFLNGGSHKDIIKSSLGITYGLNEIVAQNDLKIKIRGLLSLNLPLTLPLTEASFYQGDVTNVILDTLTEIYLESAP